MRKRGLAAAPDEGDFGRAVAALQCRRGGLVQDSGSNLKR